MDSDLERAIRLATLGVVDYGEEKDTFYTSIPPVLMDAIMFSSLIRPYWRTRSDWMSEHTLKHISPENLQTVLQKVVEQRLVEDKDLPLWLQFVCRVYDKNGWPIPGQWIKCLEGALTLASDIGFRHHFAAEAEDWLTYYRVKNDPDEQF